MTKTLLVPFLEIIRFISWWGITMPIRLWKIGWGFVLTAEDNLRLFSNIRLWFALEPLFGDYGWQGRAIGFLLRGVRIIVTICLFIMLLLLAIALVLAWYALPVFAILSIFQLSGFF